MLYKCQLCDKEFNKKSNYISHINKKNPCNKLEEKLTCENCNIKFSRSDSLLRHLKKCKCNLNINEINKKIDNLIEENKQLKEKINRLENQNIIVNNTVNNTINNTVININIINHGDEDITKLTEEELQKIINSPDDSIYKLTEYIHFNDRLPEYKNIYINNIKSKYISIYNNGEFILKEKKEGLTELIKELSSKLKYIDDSSLVPKTVRNINLMKSIKKHYYWLCSFYIEDEDIDGNIIKADKLLINRFNEIFSKIELILYNKRFMIIKNYNEVK